MLKQIYECWSEYLIVEEKNFNLESFSSILELKMITVKFDLEFKVGIL